LAGAGGFEPPNGGIKIRQVQRLIAKKKKRQLEEAKRVMELDRNLIVTAVLIVALPIIAALAAMFAVLAVGDH
jgi:hypothetical protein